MNDTIPDDCILNVFKYLTASQLCLVSFVCRRWWQLSETDYLWKGLLLFYFSLDYECLQHWGTFPTINWKTVFKEFFLQLKDCVLFLPMNEGNGPVKNYSLATRAELPFLSTHQFSRLESNIWKYVDRRMDIEAPHQRFCVELQQEHSTSLSIVLDKPHQMMYKTIGIFMKVRFLEECHQFQQNFFSLWSGDFDRIVLEFHPGGNLGVYTNRSRTWEITQAFIGNVHQWHSICLNYDQGTLEMFIDDRVVPQIPLSKDFIMRRSLTQTQRLYLGSDRHDAYWSSCQMASFAYYNRSISYTTYQNLRKL